MAMKIPERLERFIPQLESFISKGVGADKAYNLLRDFQGIRKGDRSPIPRNFVREYTRQFKQNIQTVIEPLPTMRSRHLTTKMAQPVNFHSPTGNRYLIDYRFKIVDAMTGKTQWKTLTLGLDKLHRMGFVYDEINSVLDQMEQDKKEAYLIQSIDRSSVEVLGMFRTLNR